MKHLLFKKLSIAPILSLDKLCQTLSISHEQLNDVLSLSDDEKYKKSSTLKQDGSERIVYNPHHKLRVIQRRINRRIFSPLHTNKTIQWPDYLYGSIPNQTIKDIEYKKDYVACASKHCGARSLLKIDVSNFFDNISFEVAFSVFSDFFKFAPDVSEVLAKICTYNDHVVQGALTSSYIACLCLFDLEPNIVSRIEKKNLTYTRLVDDITISSRNVNYDFSYVLDIVKNMLHEKDLPINEKKTKIYRESSTPLVVHGLRISYREARLPSQEVSRIRAAVKNIETLASEPKYRTTHVYRKEFNTCMGRVNKLKRVGHNQHRKLVDRLRKVLPKPSIKDKSRVKEMVNRLIVDSNDKEKINSYWYYKRYFRTVDRINLIARSYPALAKYLREQIKNIRPSYTSN
jgi:RNA-directed DNA polymerase